ncbi:3-deoxy-D-manno-octulosonic acid transferase [Desertivirga brevis]|uniref:3-deoxy-D-manno-octulosonic acid transferase n=1 Tax=Desertivirga brevis TaxID=2810310 RepID=UPI001A975801|nr:glycosyltransferase N-terminal domain-containing protein [Pedobacter sp. SYSU D00873]
MLILYNFGIKIYYFFIFILKYFNKKAKLWFDGRVGIFDNIASKVDPTVKKIWFHFASLGEFEQGRPVLEEMRKIYPDKKILITFFSPSGYELRKNYAGADYIFYLPMDTASNARRFLKLVNPEIVIFTKYEFWYHYFRQLHQSNVPLYLISGIFRPNQPFFKWYGSFNRKILSFVSHFFVQDEGSKELLKAIGITNVTVSGDTRFDRVAENAAAPKRFELVERFCYNSKVFVGGSTWPPDEKLLAELVAKYSDWKFVFAPHEIKADKINALIGLLPANTTVKYSEIKNLTGRDDIDQAIRGRSVLIIDNIGMLSSLYQYGKVSYIGGGFGVGIHNTLEAAAFGIPVIFGPNFSKFLEAKALIANGGGFTISNSGELLEIMGKLQSEEFRSKAGNAAEFYVEKSKGATGTILKYIEGKV